MIKIRGLLAAAIGLATMAGFAATSAQAEYPTKPITLVAPYGPGGASDLASRTLAAAVPDYIGQPVLVINRTGAGGVTGSTFVKQSRPDGYTLLLARVGSQGVTPALNATIPYKWDDFTFLGLLEFNPYVFVVRSESEYQTFAQLVDAIKANPGKLSFSTSGPGTILNMGPQMLFAAAGLDSSAARMIPYKGGGGAKTALLGGHVDFLGINLAPVLDQIQAGQLRALAVTTEDRFPAIPDVPTVKEVGYPELGAVIGWSGLWGPPGLPQDVVTVWTQALDKLKTDKAWNKMTRSLGSVPQIRDPDATRQFVQQQVETYHELGKKLGLLVQ